MDDNKKGLAPELTFQPSREQLDQWNSQINELSKQDTLSATMKVLACIVDHYDQNHMDHLQCQVYHRALDWLATLKAKLDAFKVIEYQTGSADSDGKLVTGTEHMKCMAYNTDVISDEDAETILKQGRQTMSDLVVDLWPSQAIALFPSLRGRSEDDAETAK